MALEHLSLLCTFENSTECNKISFDSDSIPNSYKVYYDSAQFSRCSIGIGV